MGSPILGKVRSTPANRDISKNLSHYVREKGLIRLEEAIRKMTSLPARPLGSKKKGLLKEGLDADIVIFDPDTVLDRATFDDPRQKPEGIVWVLINGEVAVEEGLVTGATSGKVLRWNKNEVQ